PRGRAGGQGRSRHPIAAGQRRERRAQARQLRPREEERRIRVARARSPRRQDSGAGRSRRQPPGSRLHHQPARFRGREHAAARDARPRLAVPDRPRPSTRSAAGDPRQRPARSAPSVTTTADRRASTPLPEWLPPWARQLAELYFSGTTASFILHGNTDDLFRTTGDEPARYGALPEFLVEQLFGRWAIVLHYDVGQGLRAYAGRAEQRLKEMVALTNRKIGDLSALPKDPAAALAVIDRFVRNNIMAADADRVSFALLLNQASYVFPNGEPGRLSPSASSQLVTVLNWAASPQVKQLNMAFVLIDEKLNDLSTRLAGSPHVAAIEVPLPDSGERETFIRSTGTSPTGKELASFSDFGASELAKLTAGISLADLNVLVQSAEESGKRLDTAVFRALKKRLIERQ